MAPPGPDQFCKTNGLVLYLGLIDKQQRSRIALPVSEPVKLQSKSSEISRVSLQWSVPESQVVKDARYGEPGKAVERMEVPSRSA